MLYLCTAHNERRVTEQRYMCLQHTLTTAWLLAAVAAGTVLRRVVR